MIKSQDISIVVQGPIIKQETKKCLKSIQKFFPNAEVILSTWEGSDVSDLNGLYNILVLNKDPGFGYIYKHENKQKLNNLNRQIFSTQEGLKKATKKYAMKIRTNEIFTNNTFLKFFDKYQDRLDEYKLFERKILTSTLFSRFYFDDYKGTKEISKIQLAFHVSDVWFFGLKTDLETYFDIPLAKEPDFSNYYKKEENREKFNPYIIIDETYLQFAAEQYIALECFKKHFKDISMEHAGDLNDTLIEKSRKCLINNFIFLEYKDAGIYFNKYKIIKYTHFSPVYLDVYNEYRQEYEYKKYCDNNYNISEKTKFIIENNDFQNDYMFLFIHIQRVIKFKKGFRTIEEIFITLFLCIKFIFKYYKVFFM